MIFIGYDDREKDAYDVCAFSLARRSSSPVEIQALKHKELRESGLFTRPWRVNETGQWIDERDGLPFSTQFSFTRFLVPELARRSGHSSWAMFVDCDFLFLGDVQELFRLCESDKAVMVVKHDFTPKGRVKMDGVAQVRYPRKLWSSLMLFNLRHPAVQALTPEAVNYINGPYLHQLTWLDDDAIGALPETWNFIPDHSKPAFSSYYDAASNAVRSVEETPKAIHYTEGGPWFQAYEDVTYGELWTQEYETMLKVRR